MATGGRFGRIFADWRAQEYAEDEESCFLASGNSIFELAAIEARLKEAPEPVERRLNGELEVWLPALAGKQYLVAVDPAGGGSEGDYSAAQVLDLETGLQCAEFAGHMGGLELAWLVTKLAAEYNQAWLVVERNNHGSGVLALAGGGLQIRADLSSRAGSWVADDFVEPAGGTGAAGCGSGGSSRNASRAGGCWASAGVLFGCRTAGVGRGRERMTTG